jgi:hypothetical protein
VLVRDRLMTPRVDCSVDGCTGWPIMAVFPMDSASVSILDLFSEVSCQALFLPFDSVTHVFCRCHLCHETFSACGSVRQP